jgi:hypothetical protein
MSFILSSGKITDPADAPVDVTANSAAPYFPGTLYQWSITNLDGYTTYTLSTSNGSVSRSVATINYTPSAGGTGGFTINGRNISFAVSSVATFQSRSTGTANWPLGHSVAANSSFAVGVSSNQFSSLGGSQSVFIDYRDQYGNSQWYRYIYDTAGLITYNGVGAGLGSDNSLFVSVRDTTNTFGYFIKFTPAGGTSWSKYLATFNPYGATVDASNNFIVSGARGGGLFTVAKYNTSGTLQWQVGDAALAGNNPLGLSTDAALNVYAVASTDLVKLNSSGVQQFASRVNTVAFTNVAVDSSGNIFTCGNATNGYVFKFNSSGVLQWQRVVTGVNFQGIAVDSSGNVYASGNDTSTNATVVARWNTSGAIQWQRSISSGSNQGDARIAVVGSSYYVSYTTASGFFTMLAKYLTDGTINTYGSATMAASSYTEGAGALTTAASTTSLSATALVETTATPTITGLSPTNTLTR